MKLTFNISGNMRMATTLLMDGWESQAFKWLQWGYVLQLLLGGLYSLLLSCDLGHIIVLVKVFLCGVV